MKEKNHRSSDSVESQLIKLIIDGRYKAGSMLPPERELAAELGIGRPTLREVIQRLERDGWVSVNKGQPATVNNFWKQGNLNTLANIVENIDIIPEDFIIYLLDIRAILSPNFVKDAVSLYPAKVVAHLSNIDSINDTPTEYANFDWQLQKNLAALSNNPIYLLILNSFENVYVKLAIAYFSIPENREFSLSYYQSLLSTVMKRDSSSAEKITSDAMKKSIELWKKRQEVML